MNANQFNIPHQFSNDKVVQDNKARDQKKSQFYRQFIYKLVLTIQVDIECFSFAFNNNRSILFVGRWDKKIKLYGLFSRLKLLQTLNNRLGNAVCLIFLKKTRSLIFTIYKSINVWNQDQEIQLKQQQNLTGHNDYIICMIINQGEDLLISGGFDKQIKFWKEELDQSWNCQQTINASFNVCSLSLSPSQTKLISCGDQKEIIIIENQSYQKWIIIQRVTLEEQGLRLCFLNDNVFVFQPRMKGFLEIFNHDHKNKQYRQITNVQISSCRNCSSFFPCQFIESKKILIVKHGQNVNLFGIDQTRNLVLRQSIDFGCYDQHGSLTDDGQFLVTWDYESKQIQVRNLLYLK